MNKNFFQKLTRGDFGLAKTYWLFGAVVPFTIFFIEYFFLGYRYEAIIMNKTYYLLTNIIYIAYIVMILVGVNQAAKKYQGNKIWAKLAVVAVALHGASVIIFVLGLLGINVL